MIEKEEAMRRFLKNTKIGDIFRYSKLCKEIGISEAQMRVMISGMLISGRIKEYQYNRNRYSYIRLK